MIFYNAKINWNLVDYGIAIALYNNLIKLSQF